MFEKSGKEKATKTATRISNVLFTVSSFAADQKLIILAEHAEALRDFGKLRELAGELLTSPDRQARSLALVYLGQAIKGASAETASKSTELFELALRNGPGVVWGRALLGLAGSAWLLREQETARLYAEALKHSQDACTTLCALRTLAALEGQRGNHKGTVRHLEKLMPLARYTGQIRPQCWLDYLNSLAVELAAIGQAREALPLAQLVCRSSYATAYPEWRETLADVQRALYKADRASVLIHRPADLIPFPADDRERAKLESQVIAITTDQATTTDMLRRILLSAQLIRAFGKAPQL